MQELQTMQGFPANGGDLSLGHHVECDDIGKTASLHVFHAHPQIAANKERVHEVDDVLVLAISHDQDLVNDEVFLWLLFEVHLLDSDALVRSDFKCRVNATRSTLANLDKIAELLRRVGRIANILQLTDDLSVGD